MSELRDLTVALRAFDTRLTSIEDCLVILVRDSQQQAQWRHIQKNRAMVEDGLRDDQERAMLQVQEACGAISHKLMEVVQSLESHGALRQADVRSLSMRIGKLEDPEETTKP